MEFLTEKPQNVSFGTTVHRPLFPISMPPTRFGNEMKPIRGQPNTGPGAYEKEGKTNFVYQADHFVTSNKGYTLGARTGPRFRKEFVEVTPSPGTYQTKCTEPITFKPSYKSFLSDQDRFRTLRAETEDAAPGPGAYEHAVQTSRHVQWHQSFGGSPIKMPEVQIKSTIGPNTQKLLSTRDAKKYQRRLAYMKLYWD